MARELQTIYEYFGSYTKEQVDAMLEKLTAEEKGLITLRYGEDLNNPTSGKLSKEETNKFYGSLIPKMKKMLSNPNKERKPRVKRTTEKQPPIKNPIPKISSLESNSLVEEVVSVSDELVKHSEIEETHEAQNVETMTKEDYIKILELIRTPVFNQMMCNLPVKEFIISALIFGYVDGKYFSIDSISNFLEIEPQEVIDIRKKVLLLYKETFSNHIDNAIKIATEQPIQLKRKP